MAEVFSQGGSDQDMSAQVKKIMFITDSMTAAELDSDGSLFYDKAPPASTDKENTGKKAKKPADYSPREPNKRVLRVARGCGVTVDQVEEILVQHRMFGGVVKQFGGLANMAKMQKGGAGARGQPRPDASQMAAMQKMLVSLPCCLAGLKRLTCNSLPNFKAQEGWQHSANRRSRWVS